MLNQGLRLAWTGSVVVALAAVACVPAHAARGGERRWSLTSPDGRVAADIRSAPGGPLLATVRHDGLHVVSSTIGLTAGSRCLPEGYRFAGQAARGIRASYVTPAGKRRAHRYRARRLVLRFRQGRSRLAVHLHAAGDGFAYRTVLSGPAVRGVSGECSAFTAAPDAGAWLQRFHRAYENVYAPGLLRDAAPGAVAFPALLATGTAWALLTEGAIPPGQPANQLEIRAGDPGALHVFRRHVESGLTRLQSPWRVAVIGSLATIVASDLVDDLAPPAAQRDWSWIRPGRVAWSWWSESGSPSSFERQRQYVDFASRMGWEYVLVDAGWDGAWIPDLASYAREQGVGVLLWSRWDALEAPARRDALLARWAGWGVAGVKVDFVESDSQQRMRWYRDVARAAAARRLLVNFHGSTAPRGLSRTWPNVLTMEGVIGAESYKGALTPATPAHNATLPFTRNAIGPMDYTPVTFSTAQRQTTDAHELALSVVFASGLQHFADRPEAYDAHPLAAHWLAGVPAAWDDTRLLDGYPGVSATVARRVGSSWFVGAIRSGEGGLVDLPLGFLALGREYVAWTIEDGPTGGLVARSRRVTAADALRLELRPAGGYVARFTPVPR